MPGHSVLELIFPSEIRMKTIVFYLFVRLFSDAVIISDYIVCYCLNDYYIINMKVFRIKWLLLAVFTPLVLYLNIVKVKVKQFPYRPGVAQRVPGS